MTARRRPGRRPAQGRGNVQNAAKDALSRLQNILKPHFADLQPLAQADLTSAQFWTMMLLFHDGSLTVSGIADAIGLSRAATSHLLEQLVTRHLVERDEDPDDRRQRRIQLAREGLRLISVFHAARQSTVRRIVRSLNTSNQRRLIALVDQVVAILPRPDERPR